MLEARSHQALPLSAAAPLVAHVLHTFRGEAVEAVASCFWPHRSEAVLLACSASMNRRHCGQARIKREDKNTSSSWRQASKLELNRSWKVLTVGSEGETLEQRPHGGTAAHARVTCSCMVDFYVVRQR